MFTQPCFIKKNTPELRNKLEELGYKPSYPIFQYPEVFKHIAACNFFGSKYYGVSDDELSCHGEIIDVIKNGGIIDCGDNEDLFLALSALRDDTDINQWFVMDCDVYLHIDKGDWFIATDINKGKHIGTQIDPMYCHKATVEEIIEHFKDI